MDPALMPAILHSLIPIFAVLAVFGCPVGIIWVVKNHQYRMKELEVESQRPPARVFARCIPAVPPVRTLSDCALDRFDRQRTGLLAGRVPAHAVGDNQESALRPAKQPGVLVQM